jgi:hypothetical protein
MCMYTGNGEFTVAVLNICPFWSNCARESIGVSTSKERMTLPSMLMKKFELFLSFTGPAQVGYLSSKRCFQ